MTMHVPRGRRRFLKLSFGSLVSGGSVLLTEQKQAGAQLQEGEKLWKTESIEEFKAKLQWLSQQEDKTYLVVDLATNTVKGFQGPNLLKVNVGEGKTREALFLCDQGDEYNPTISGLFRPDTSHQRFYMSGRKKVANNQWSTYNRIEANFVIFFYQGYAFHTLTKNYTAVGARNSAGCVRLSFADAQLLFRLHRQNPFTWVLVGRSRL